jgi:hypothetical protein
MLRALAMCMVALAIGSAHAEDGQLTELDVLLSPMRVERHDDAQTRGATPALTTVKHKLRDWIEERLAALDEKGDLPAWTVEVNGALRSADLLCHGAVPESPDRCADKHWDSVGFLSPVDVERQETGRVLTVHTGVGILCGWDESAYVYERRGRGWARIWQTEEGIDSGSSYRPQYITGVHVSSPVEKTGDRYVLSLGHMGWCSSYLYPVYFRLWRVGGADGQPTLLLDEEQPAYVGQHVPPIEGSIGKNDALIEFTVPSVDREIHFYESIWHYQIEGNKVQRIDPVALNPRDFVDEWLRQDWAFSSRLTRAANRTALRPWHARLHDKKFAGRYVGAPQRCTKATDQWQIGIDFGEPDKSTDIAYFLVRWRPPYHFEMSDVRPERRGDCNQGDDPDSGSLDTLFPIQEWR